MNEHRISSSVIRDRQIKDLLPNVLLLAGVDALAATALFIFVIFAIGNYESTAYLWFGGTIALSLSRAAIIYFSDRVLGYSDNLKATAALIVASALISGCIWGTTWMMHPTLAAFDAPRGAILSWPTLIIFTSAIYFGPFREAFFTLAITATSGQVAHLIYLGDERNLQIAAGYVVLVAIASLVAININRDRLRATRADMLVQRLREDLIRDERTLKAKEAELLERIDREERLIEAKKLSDNKLQEANEEKLLLLDAIGEGILGVNSEGNITFINPAALSMLNYTEQETLDQNAVGLLCKSTTATGLEAETRQVLNSCVTKGATHQNVQGVFSGSNHQLLPVNFACRPVKKDQTLIGVVISFTDETQRKDMEAKLVQSQKMEAMGRITGGVAHDFNNLLTVILGNLQFLKRRYFKNTDGNGAELVDKIMSAAKSGADLNSRLLSYSREQSLQNELTDLKKLLLDMDKFLQRILGEQVKVNIEFDESSAAVMIDRNQFENVVINLCLNARDAMPEGGTLTIGSRKVVLDESPVVKLGVGNEREETISEYLELIFSDTGTGVPLDIQEKIFDPFFTTKERGKGTGFGLSTAYGFLQQSGGSIRVESVPGEGATFILVLPLVQQEPEQDTGAYEDEADLMSYNGTILVVEDDDGVREIACQTLLDAGYQVLLAENGNKGLEQFQKHRNIDLVFSDIIMPGGMTGVEMAEEIQSIKPIPILLATGYAEKMLKDRVESESNVVCISKPYDIEELPSLIDSMLQQEAS
ncbi:MAG: response regulator [Pseudomonadales bacterium]|nr:response regulator [Pseudomonadales bacterium]